MFNIKNQPKSLVIGIDARMYGEAQTGIGTYIKYLIGNLLALDYLNQYVIFLFPSEVKNFKFQISNFKNKVKNFKIVEVNSHWYGWKEQLVLPWQMIKEGVDLMHFPHFNMPILYPGKFVVTIHDLTPKFFPGHKIGKYWHRRKAFDFVFSSALKRSEKIIAVSNYTKNEILKYYDITEEKIKVIYEGVKLNFQFLPTGSRVLDRIGTISNFQFHDLKQKYKITKPFIFYTGVWRDHKNLVGLIKAFNILTKKYKLNYQLVLGGKEDSYYPEVRQTWEKLGLKVNNLNNQQFNHKTIKPFFDYDIICPGFIPENELPLFYQAADLFILPSFSEGFGLVGVEAMGFRLPVAASRVTSLPEVFGEAALYFDPIDIEDMAKKMRQVLSSEELKEKLISKGSERIKRYSWERTAEETLKIYEEILENT